MRVVTTVLIQTTAFVCVYKKQQKKKYPARGVCILKKSQRITKKGFRYEILPSTENSPRCVKDYNEYCTLYNRLAELEDKIENGLLVPRHSISQDWQYGWWCVYGVDEQGIIIAQCKTEEEAKRKLEELER